MIWLGLVGGVVLGAAIWGLEGAVTLGFIGWLAGVIIKSQRKPKTGDAPGTHQGRTRDAAGTDPGSLDERVARLEATVARLERRLAGADELGPRAVAAGAAPGATSAVVPDAAPEPVIPDAAPAATVRDPSSPAPQPFAKPAEPGPRPIAAEAAAGVTMDPAPAEPPPPLKPNPIVAWLTGGNTIARVGLLILFFGFAFLLKYAADNRLLPPEVRIAGVAGAGIALLVLGWRLRAKREGYALGLQGAGVAVLYLTTFAAMKMYALLPAELAFLLLAGIAVFSAALAILQNSAALAVIGAGGGFLAPILASSGGGSHVMLFSYYLVLNLGIAAIAWFKAWRSLNLTGFAFTFLILGTWGWRAYNEEIFASTEFFLIAFFLVYVAISVMVAREAPVPDQGQARARSGPGPGSRYVDTTLVFGVPLAFFALQAGTIRHIEFGMAFSALAVAALYLALSWRLSRMGRESWSLLAQSFMALGVVFVTLAIPLALDARWTSASWALEGAGIIWIALRQNRRIALWFGLLLQLGAGAAYVFGYNHHAEDMALVDPAFMGAVLIAIAGLWSHRLLVVAGKIGSRAVAAGAAPGMTSAVAAGAAPGMTSAVAAGAAPGMTSAVAAGAAPGMASGAGAAAAPGMARERMLVKPLFAWGLAWTIFAALDETDTHLPHAYEDAANILVLSVLAIAFGILARRWNWAAAAWAARALLPVLFLPAIAEVFEAGHPLGNFGWIAWPVAIGAMAWILKSVVPERRGRYTTFLHAGTMVLAALVGAQELHWLAADTTARGTAWSVAAAIVIPAVLVLLASSRAADARWPITGHERAYRYHAALLFALAFAAWSLFANLTHDARSDPLPYLPLVNALDLGHGLVAIAIVSAWRAMRRSSIEPPEALTGRTGLAIAGGLAFVWLNGVLLRTVSHWAGIPYTAGSMVPSVVVQASLSIFWAMLALAAMAYATRTARRALWMLGAGLMGVVVAKLFLVDLSNVGGIERIVSFIAVGVLMLVIGYFSPVPPKNAQAAP